MTITERIADKVLKICEDFVRPYPADEPDKQPSDDKTGRLVRRHKKYDTAPILLICEADDKGVIHTTVRNKKVVIVISNWLTAKRWS